METANGSEVNAIKCKEGRKEPKGSKEEEWKERRGKPKLTFNCAEGRAGTNFVLVEGLSCGPRVDACCRGETGELAGFLLWVMKAQ